VGGGVGGPLRSRGSPPEREVLPSDVPVTVMLLLGGAIGDLVSEQHAAARDDVQGLMCRLHFRPRRRMDAGGQLAAGAEVVCLDVIHDGPLHVLGVLEIGHESAR
jgi:hypothetical protein